MRNKEFLKLDNRLILKLEIIPISPLLIKLGESLEEDKKTNDEKKKLNNEESEDKNIIFFMTNETPQGKKLTEYTKEKDRIKEDRRKGEIFIPGSTIKGLFRERFNNIYDILNNRIIHKKEEKYEKVEKLFGNIDKETKKATKSRIFIQDAYLSNEEYRKIFFEDDEEKKIKLLNEIIKTRSITPIDAFTGKAVTPLKFEYTTEKFSTEVIVNNIEKDELQKIFFIIRDSLLGEIRIGNSKTRGFGQIKFNIKDLIFENYKGNSYILKLENYFDLDEENSIKIGDNYLRKSMILKEKYKEVNIDSPNEFIKTLFSEVE